MWERLDEDKGSGMTCVCRLMVVGKWVVDLFFECVCGFCGQANETIPLHLLFWALINVLLSFIREMGRRSNIPLQ